MANLSYPGVYMEEVSGGVRPIAASATSTAAFIGVTERGPLGEAKRITNWTEYQRYFGMIVSDRYLAQSVFQFFNNGGQQCYVVRVTGSSPVVADVTVKNRAVTPENGLKFMAKNEGSWGNEVYLQIEDGSFNSANTFKLSIRKTNKTGLTDAEILELNPVEVHDNLSMDEDSASYVVSALNKRSYLVAAQVLSTSGTYAEQRPANADVIRIGMNTVADPVSAVTAGSNGTGTPAETEHGAAFQTLNSVTDFSILAVPGIGTTTMVDLGMSYCANRPLQDVFYIGEMADTEDEPADAEAFRATLTTPNSYGAVYFPWVKALDITGKSQEPVLLPPSGYIAGLYARIDSQRGVWKAPAGTEATLRGALGLTYDLTDVEQGNLNLLNINCIRRFPGSGIVNWGARTITSDTEWNYVPVRRTAMMLRTSIYNGIQWAVFEPNDEDLWGQIRLNLNSFMMTLFRKGAFQGASPSEAFFVKCDSETTPQEDIDLGIVNVLVGFAPVKPAEFVVVRISQKVGQGS